MAAADSSAAKRSSERHHQYRYLMNKNTQYGKGLFGFFFGLLLATGVIGGILYFLNQDTPNAFKGATEPQKQQTSLKSSSRRKNPNLNPSLRLKSSLSSFP